jgi:hypothetical protein
MIVAGDILAVRGTGWLSDGIARAEYGANEPQRSATHVGLFISGSPEPIVVEALSRVRTNPLSVSLAGAQKAFVLHDLTLTDAQRLTIVNKALTFSGKDYGYLDIAAQWLDGTFSTHFWTGAMSGMLKHWPICSYVVGAAYHEIGLDFGVDSASVRPSDILTFAETHPKRYIFVPAP